MTGIAIVGMACRYPDATSPEELWRMVLARRQAFRRLPPERLRLEDYAPRSEDDPDSIYPIQAAVLENYSFDRRRFRVPLDTYAATDLTHWLALEMAAEALADAGFADGNGLPRADTGVIVANTLTGEFSRAAMLRLRWPYVRRLLYRALEDRAFGEADRHEFLHALEEHYKAPFAPPNTETLAGGLANTIAGRICNQFNFGGGGYTVDGACASSLLAVTTACGRLLLGEIDVAIAGAVDLSLDPFELVGFARNGALAQHDMRPFDARAEGFWPGEGAGFLVLMREPDAAVQHRSIHAVIRGYGVSSDGEGGLTRPTRDGQALALSRAYRMAGFGADEVSYFEGHGTATSVGDPVEIEALAEIRRRHGARAPAALGSIKANIGHTKAAAGMAGLIKAVMAIKHQVIPPSTGLHEPSPSFKKCAGVLEPAKGETWPLDRPLRAGVSAMGFGGINTHVVVERDADERRQSLDDSERRLLSSWQDAELFLFAAADRNRLIEQIDQLGASAPRLSRAELSDVAAALARRLKNGRVRAAVVARSPTELAEHLSQLRDWIEAGIEHRLDLAGQVFVGSGTRSPRIGFLFPGQAAPSHLGGGIWRKRFAEVAALYAKSGLPDSGDGTNTVIAQPAIVTASLAGLGILERLGIAAVAAVGHSLGELVALHWAGACDQSALYRIVAGRSLAMGSHAKVGGRMTTLRIAPDRAASLIEGIAAEIACYNGVDECVLSGDAAAIETALKRAAEQGIVASPLKVSHAFHSPHMEPAIPVFGQMLSKEVFAPLRRRVHSTITGSVLPANVDLAPLVCQQLVAPVRFRDATERLRGEIDLFIEVGPGHGLARLGEALTATPAVSLDVGGPSLHGLLTAVGAAFALGVQLTPEQLFAGRFVRPFDLDRALSFLANPCERVPVPREASVRSAAKGPVRYGIAATSHEGTARETNSPLDLFRRLIAARTGLPIESIERHHRLLSDLHLNSINVAELVTRFAKELGVGAIAAPAEYANASVSDVVDALAELRAADGAAPLAEEHPAGVDSWERPFVTRLVESALPATARREATGWRVIAPEGYSLKDELVRSLAAPAEASPEHGLVLCLPPNPDMEHLTFLLEGAQEVLRDGVSRLMLVQHGGGGAGFARSLFLERRSLQVNVVDLPIDVAAAAQWAAHEAACAGPGYTEAYYDELGTRRVPVLSALAVAPATERLPIGPADVLLVSGGGKGIGAECALALAKKTGARLGLIGTSPQTDADLAANLVRMQEAGLKVCYARADVTDATSVRLAVARIEEELGSVTALLHAAGINRPQLLDQIDHKTLRTTVAVKVDGARNLLAALQADKLRLVVAFGSIIARVGLSGESHYALANDWLDRSVEDFAVRHPRCRCLTLHWSVWAGTGMGERLGTLETLVRQGISPISIDQGLAALESVLQRKLHATSIVVSGRFGNPPTVVLENSALPLLRFLERPRVHYPGVELVADAELSVATDLYLRDHVIGGTTVVPAVFALEAMAQAVSALAGVREPPTFEAVEFLRPVVADDEGGVTIRTAALRRDDRIELVMRSSSNRFQIDHVRATAVISSVPSVAGNRPYEPAPEAEGPRLSLEPGRDLYGRMLFQGHRFRRLAGYRGVAAAGCIADIAPAEVEGWFTPYHSADLILGDPGARDAGLHALQVCVPHKRVLPVSVERVTLGQLDPKGAYSIIARERESGADSFTFDVDLLDQTGRIVERWEGLTLRAIEPLQTPERWPVPLLGAYFERCLSALWPDSALRVAFEAKSRLALANPPALAEEEQPTRSSRRPDGKPEAKDGAVSVAYGGDFRLLVTAAGPIGCDIEPVDTRREEIWRNMLGAQRFQLAQSLAQETGEDVNLAATRVWSVMEGVRKAGLALGTPVVLDAVGGEGWITLRAGLFAIASAVLGIEGEDRQFTACFVAERPHAASSWPIPGPSVPALALAPRRGFETERTAT